MRLPAGCWVVVVGGGWSVPMSGRRRRLTATWRRGGVGWIARRSRAPWLAGTA